MKQRILKFRAWDTDRNEFVSDVRNHTLSMLNNNYAGLGNRYEYQQFTGLLDRNGKEIYESDIVKFRHRLYAQKEMTGTVFYSAENAAFMIVWGDEEFMLHECDLLEVIGNEHESADF